MKMRLNKHTGKSYMDRQLNELVKTKKSVYEAVESFLEMWPSFKNKKEMVYKWLEEDNIKIDKDIEDDEFDR